MIALGVPTINSRPGRDDLVFTGPTTEELGWLCLERTSEVSDPYISRVHGLVEVKADGEYRKPCAEYAQGTGVICNLRGTTGKATVKRLTSSVNLDCATNF
jgi:hypothetical protein